MRYEQFKVAWEESLRASRLRIRPGGEESLDVRSLARTYRVYVEPIGGTDVPPFYVLGVLSWRWDALTTARAETTEEDMISMLSGRRGSRFATTRPWLRVDIQLSASLDYGKGIPLPSTSAWKKWNRETRTRFDTIEPLIPANSVREGKEGLKVMAWSGAPGIKATCDPDGALKLESLQWSAWQAVELPRHFDDSSRKPDPSPDKQLRKLFERVRAALQAWKEALDHLT